MYRTLKLNLDLRQWYGSMKNLDIFAVRIHNCDTCGYFGIFLLGVGLLLQFNWDMDK